MLQHHQWDNVNRFFPEFLHMGGITLWNIYGKAFFFFFQRVPLSLNVMTPRRRSLRIKFVLMTLCSFSFGWIAELSKSIFAVTVLKGGKCSALVQNIVNTASQEVLSQFEVISLVLLLSLSTFQSNIVIVKQNNLKICLDKKIIKTYHLVWPLVGTKGI